MSPLHVDWLSTDQSYQRTPESGVVFHDRNQIHAWIPTASPK